MRTLVRGGWIVGYAGGTHTLVRDGVVVFEEDRIVHVGPRFDGGPVIGMLQSEVPGPGASHGKTAQHDAILVDRVAALVVGIINVAGDPRVARRRAKRARDGCDGVGRGN